MNPAPQHSIERYRRKAAGYDASAARTMPLRSRTIALLALQPDEVVLDVGAGTGLSYALLRQAVGPRGRVLAFEQSPEMFAQAEARLRREGWTDVQQVLATAETVRLPMPVDALLFNFTHDILRSPAALDNLLRQARPGARIAVCGMKFFPWWTGPLNLLPWLKNRPYNVRAAELWRPWDLLQPRCTDWRQWSVMGGMGYLARARTRSAA
jgi:demethylmenaquinone methyltransferase/2-methoxy-6-polyprenyl-1,4-benzoquinol methylase